MKEIPDVERLVAAVHEQSPSADSLIHGDVHWRQVAAVALRIIDAGSQADPAATLIFALLHDSQRHSEGRDPRHGARAADFAAELHGEHFGLDLDRMVILTAALVDHDGGQTSDDRTVGTCWDADRLTLARLPMVRVSSHFLSTEEGRRLIPEARALVGDEPPSWAELFDRYAEQSEGKGR
jgi:uncharacterized protein